MGLGHSKDIKSRGALPGSVDGDGNSVAGLVVTVGQIQLQSWQFGGGSITLPGNGVWYVGVEFWSRQVRALPRLGHRGWVPVVRATVVGGQVTELRDIQPAMPACRIPRTMAKVLRGEGIKAVVLGSSLAESSADTSWVGMLMSPTALVSKYKIPTAVAYVNAAKGGAPNAYGFAQTGRATAFNASLYDESGFPLDLSELKAVPNGRSQMFAGVDVVFVACLANGGSYRVDLIEPTIRSLRVMGVEVVLVTDNPQNPSLDYATMTSAALYVDGPSVMEVADLYGVELADTAAFVAEAHIRAGGVGIYSDSIHMAGIDPVGPAAVLPGSGHEAWARAIRGIFHAAYQELRPTQVSRTFDFSNNADGIIASTIRATLTVNAGKLVVTKNTSEVGQWGARVPFIGGVRTGDTVRVQGVLNHTYAAGFPQIGLQGGGAGWASTVAATPANPGGAFDVLLTATRDALSDSYVLLFASADSSVAGATNSWSNLVITVQNASNGVTSNAVPGRAVAVPPMPASRVVADLKIPGAMQVILPQDEYRVRVAAANAGTLGAHPAGSASFARRWSSSVGATSDLLTLTAGQIADIASFGVVGIGVIIYGETTTSCTVEVWNSTVKLKDVVFGAGNNREAFAWLLSPTEFPAVTASPTQRSYQLRVTAGTLKVAALVAATSDFEVIRPSNIEFKGTWSADLVTGGSPNMQGKSTDTLGSYARLKCPAGARRISWIISSKANSKMVDTWAGGSATLAQATTGANHIRVLGGHVGPDDEHYIRCAEVIEGGGGAAAGYSLHVGGAIAVADR